MLIYRIEGQDGRGPYTGRDMSFNHSDIKKHPNLAFDSGMPFNDFSVDQKGRRKMAFGFDSMLKLRAWFNEKERELLQEYEFVLKTFEVQKTYVSASQALFDYENAELLNTSKDY